MNEFYPTEFTPIEPINPKKAEERRKIKKVSNLIGATYLAVWLFPDILNTLLSDIIKIIGPTPQMADIFSDPSVTMVLQTVFSILMFTLPFLILPIGTGKRVTELAFIKKPKPRLFVAFTLIGVGVSAFANLVTSQLSSIFSELGINFLSPEVDFPQGVFGFMLSFVAIAITPALVEEFATRGMVMGASREFGESFGLITSATFFALMHGNLVQIPFAFIMGLIIGFAVIKSGSLVTGMAIHFVNNAISVTMSYLLEKIESIKVESVISLLYLVACALIFIIGLALAQKKGDKIWHLEKGESLHTTGEKLKIFFFSPCIIASFGAAAIDCAGMITLG